MLTAIGALVTCIGVGMIVKPGEGGQQTVETGICCAVSFLLLCMVPGVGLIVISRRWRRRVDRVHTIKALASTHGRLTYARIAQHVDVSRHEVPELLLEAVNSGLIDGRLDGDAETFISGSVSGGAVREVVADCPGCGATGVRVHVHAGGSPTCPYCRTALPDV